MVEEVSWTYCGQCRCWTTGPKEHRTTTHSFMEVSLQNPQGANPTSDPTDSPDTPDQSLAHAGPDNSAAGGVNPKSIMAADHGGNPDIGGNSAYDVSSLSLVGPLFISGSVTSESKPPTSDDVDVGAPDF